MRPRGRDLRAWRRKRRWSLDRLTAALPCSRSHLHRIETGESDPSIDVAIVIEELTKGDIPVESWPSLAAVARLIERRGGKVAA